MIRKITLVLAAAGVLGCSSSVFAESTSTKATLQQEIKTLQAQLAALETKVNKNQSASAKSSKTSTVGFSNTLPESTQTTPLIAPSNVLVANYVGVEPRFDGFNLIVNNPGVNNDVALLKLRKSEINAYEQSGQTYTGEPKVIFSGEVEGSSVYTTPYNTTPAGTNFNLTDAELDTFIEGNRWVSGFMTFTYNSGSDGEVNAVNNSELQLGQGYVTIGDLTTSPFYGSIGQMYLPFGRYTNFIVSSPSTKTLGRIQTRAINVGYHSTDAEVAPFAAVYGYQGATEIDGNPASNDDVEDYGANVGVNFAKGDYSATLGTSYTSSIASSSGLQGNGSAGSGFAQNSTSEQLANRVPGVDINSLVSYKDYTLLAEYVEATKEFDASDLSYNGHGAQPKALDIEAAYSFELWRPSYVAVDYGQSWQSLSLGVPAKNYGIVYSTAILRNTSLTLELMHNIGYSNSDSAELDGQATSNNAGQGESYNSASLRFDLFF
jgi:hypothetical protein